MDADRFDAFSRSLTQVRSRRTALAALLGSTFGLVGLDRTKAKEKCPSCKKAKNGKCKKNKPDGTACPGGACQGGRCQPAVNPPPVDPCPGQKPCNGACIPTNQCCTGEDCPAGYRCCNRVCSDTKKPTNATCTLQLHTECCSNYCQADDRPNAGAFCAATCRGKRCQQDSDCCRDFACLTATTASPARFCGGCKDNAAPCASDAECCFSECTNTAGNPQKECVSYPGGPCAKAGDCRACWFGGECTVTIDGATRGICYNGVCQCPDTDECCENRPCLDPLKTCVLSSGGLNGTCQKIIVGPPP